MVIAAGIALALAVGAGVFPTAAVAARLSPTPTPSPSPSPTPAPTPTPEPTPVVETVRFSASGDNLIHEGLYNQAPRPCRRRRLRLYLRLREPAGLLRRL